jgi:hypothetical protein
MHEQRRIGVSLNSQKRQRRRQFFSPFGEVTKEIIELLVSAGADLNTTDLRGDIPAGLLTDMGMGVIESSDKSEGGSGFSPVMYACVRGDVEGVHRLLSEDVIGVSE